VLDRGQELLQEAIDDQVNNIDFSGFWQNVERKLSAPEPTWQERMRVRWESWLLLWPWRAPVWAAAAALLFVGLALLFSRQPSIFPFPPHSPRSELLVLADNEAQIESLSASDTISVWNEPTSNVTVIWVSDEGDGGLP
jgi:hypothetical protein